jgi:hypothetical protein
MNLSLCLFLDYCKYGQLYVEYREIKQKLKLNNAKETGLILWMKNELQKGKVKSSLVDLLALDSSGVNVLVDK